MPDQARAPVLTLAALAGGVRKRMLEPGGSWQTYVSSVVLDLACAMKTSGNTGAYARSATADVWRHSSEGCDAFCVVA
jgi:hypothetical protein